MDLESLKLIKVSEIMTPNPMTVHTDTILDRVKDIFDKEVFHHLPVVDDDEILVGIISKTDLWLLLDWGTRYNTEESERKNHQLLYSNTAMDFCTKEVMAVRPVDSLQSCYFIFRENCFRSLPVIDFDQKLVGIVTPYDLMAAAFH